MFEQDIAHSAFREAQVCPGMVGDGAPDLTLGHPGGYTVAAHLSKSVPHQSFPPVRRIGRNLCGNSTIG